MRLAFPYRSLCALALTGAASCTTFDRELVCASSTECVRDVVQGSCVDPGHCAFEDGVCGSGLRWDSTARESFAN